MINVRQLNNGMTFISERIEFVRSIALGIWIKSGSRYETEELNGISHFIEHMLFKGTVHNTAKELAGKMDRVGGQINAYTSKEYTCFYTLSLDEHFKESLDILHDMLKYSTFNEKDINKEKGVIKDEINMYEDTPDELVIDELHGGIFKGSSLARPILGTEESLAGINRDMIMDYFGKKFVPENMTICIVGNFDDEATMELLNNTFGSWDKSGFTPEVVKDTPYNAMMTMKEKDIEQIHCAMSYKGLPLGHDDAFALSIFSTLFGGGVSSRLFQHIREEAGLTYSIYSYTSGFLDTGIFSINTAFNPNQFDEVMKRIMQEIQLVKTKDLTDDEIYTTKEHLKSSIILGLESSSSRMSNLGKSQLLLGRYRTPDEIIKKINAITREDVQSVMRRVLDPKNLGLSIVGPVKDLSVKGIKDLCKM